MSKNLKYEIPTNINKLLNKDFLKIFYTELHKIYGTSLNDTDMDTYIFFEGTSGWEKAFYSACKIMKNDTLYSYYYQLPWSESDIFSGLITDLLVKNKLVLQGFTENMISKQNNGKKVDICFNCGNYNFVENMIPSKINPDIVGFTPIVNATVEAIDFQTEEDKEENIYYSCKNCADAQDFEKIHFDIKKEFAEQLNLKETDYFFCEKCKTYHIIKHRHNDTCLYCELLEKK